MADSKECAVCKKMMKNKHKLDLLYKIGFWVFLIFCIILSVLYVGSGDLIQTTEKNVEIENNTDVDINDSDGNTVNIDNGDYNIP